MRSVAEPDLCGCTKQQSLARDAQDSGADEDHGHLRDTSGKSGQTPSAAPTGGQIWKGKADGDGKQEDSGEIGKGGNR